MRFPRRSADNFPGRLSKTAFKKELRPFSFLGRYSVILKAKRALNWPAYIREFKTYLRLERSLAANTIDAYERDIGKLCEFLRLRAYELSPAQLEVGHLQEFILWVNELGLGARSQARLLSALKTFFRYLLIEEVIEADPTELLEGPRLDRKLPEVLSYEEIQRLLAAIDLSTDHGVRNRAMLETLYACGLRVSELCDLRLSNLFLDVGFIKVIGKGDKERIVPIGETAVKHIGLYIEGVRRRLRNIQKGHENMLFLNRRGRRLSRVMVFMVVKGAARDAGLNKNVSPHTFRHSFATHLIEGGADLKAVQDMLGHESILTTEIYTHLDTDYLRDTIMSFHPRNRKR